MTWSWSMFVFGIAMCFIGVVGGVAFGRTLVLSRRIDELERDVDRILGRERARQALGLVAIGLQLMLSLAPKKKTPPKEPN